MLGLIHFRGTAVFSAALLLITCLQAQALTLPATDATIFGQPVNIRYGDFNSYSLPILDFLDDLEGDLRPSFAVNSSPGQLNDKIVVFTGAGGVGANSAVVGPNVADDPYTSPGGGPSSFSIFDETDPGGAGEFVGDSADTWDIRISALNSYLAGDSIAFMFNHNETGGAQDLLAFAQIILKDDEGVLPDVHFDFINDPDGGAPNGDVADYTSPGRITSPAAGDFVLAIGDFVTGLGPTINHNLGANDVAYAVYSPELDALLKSAGAGGYDVLQIDVRLQDIDNGFEQLFIMGVNFEETPDDPDDPQDPPTNAVPEPISAALGLTALSALALAAGRRRR